MLKIDAPCFFFGLKVYLFPFPLLIMPIDYFLPSQGIWYILKENVENV